MHKGKCLLEQSEYLIELSRDSVEASRRVQREAGRVVARAAATVSECRARARHGADHGRVIRTLPMHPRFEELLDYLDRQREILRATLDAVPIADRERQPSPDRWSPAGIVEHLAIVERRIAFALSQRVTAARAAAMADGAALDETSTDPILPTMDLTRVTVRSAKTNAPSASHPTGMSAADAWSALERAGEEVRDVLRKADGMALGSITHQHPALGPLNLYEWFAFVGSHETRHAAQIRDRSGKSEV